jgi:hypothetical protein
VLIDRNDLRKHLFGIPDLDLSEDLCGDLFLRKAQIIRLDKLCDNLRSVLGFLTRSFVRSLASAQLPSRQHFVLLGFS